MMILGKVTAAIVAMVLVFQSGCDLLCQQAEEIASMQQSTIPPCHDTGGHQKSGHQDRHGSHGSSQDCLHPEAADDSSKFQIKIVKANQPIVVAGFSAIPLRLQFAIPVVATSSGGGGISPSGPPASVLRI